MLRFYTVLFILFIIYIGYLRPKFQFVSHIHNNDIIKKHLENVFTVYRYDPRSCDRAKSQLNQFFENYGRSFEITGSDKFILKMIKCKKRCLKYLHRIPFRLPNDPNLEDSIKQSINTIENTLENYLTKASSNNKFRYFPNA